MSLALPHLSPHLASLPDVILGFSTCFLVSLSLLPPPTRTIKLLRAGVIAPIAAGSFAYCAHYPLQKDWEEQWGTSVLMISFVVKVLELLVFFPAEENVWRLKPRRGSIARTQLVVDGIGGGKVPVQVDGLVAEPIPLPWTWEKFCWATSLWWSWRGIGWNYTCSLPFSSTQPPYSRHSSRKAYLARRLRYYISGWLIHDFVRSFMNVSPSSPFFSAQPSTRAYQELTQLQRATHSLAIATRVVWSLEKSHVAVGMLFVVIGGATGWEGEIWSPWGWPPMFGSLVDVWRYPGLSYMWSRTWQQYFRRWLYLFGWIGIGENVLGLPRSGPSSHPQPARSKTATNVITPGTTFDTSDRTSPTHPVPTKPSRLTRSTRPYSIPIMLSNLVKSLIVFTLTGWIHDQASFLVMLYTRPNRAWTWRDCVITTPFFVAQPFALALEGFVKTTWRSRKEEYIEERGRASAGSHDTELRWLVSLERLVGFIWTWVWLGWTAGWFVDGLTRVGIYGKMEGQREWPSLAGGLLWGAWKH